jgi:hypothetical protein
VARTLRNLASLYAYQGRYAEAEPLRRRAEAIFERWRSLGEQRTSDKGRETSDETG